MHAVYVFSKNADFFQLSLISYIELFQMTCQFGPYRIEEAS